MILCGSLHCGTVLSYLKNRKSGDNTGGPFPGREHFFRQPDGNAQATVDLDAWIGSSLCTPKCTSRVELFWGQCFPAAIILAKKGWIYQEDPRGWFQWYCRYYRGRRCPDDQRQINRWSAMRRHIAQIQSHCNKGDSNCRPKQRQTRLHWAYDSRNI
jgi:hypothetical protein